MPDELEIELGKRLDRIKDRIDKFRFASAGNVSVVGDLRTGLAVNVDEAAILEQAGGIAPPPPTVGACCIPNQPCIIQTAAECATLGGTYQGDATTCSPDPCPTGACCLPDNSCSLLTAGQCRAAGGTYQGDGTACDPNPCIVCPTASVVCDSVSASKSKCGFSEFPCYCDDGVGGTFCGGVPCSTSIPPKFYLKKYVHNSWSIDQICYNSGANTCVSGQTGEYERTEKYDSTAALGGADNAFTNDHIVDCVHSNNITINNQSGTDCLGVTTHPTFATDTSFAGDSSLMELFPCCCKPGYAGDTQSCSKTLRQYSHSFTGNCHTDQGCPVDCSPATYTYQQSYFIELVDEYTTAMLKSTTIAALPAFDGIYGDPCGAIYDLVTDESTFTIARYKYKFTFSSPAPTGMSLQWDQSGPDGVVHHTWIATGGETESPVFEEDEPTTNGTTNTINITTSCG